MLGTQPMIVLSSGTAVKDLLDRRGNIYSDRADSYIATMASGDYHTLTLVREASEVILGPS
jgi:hypothetical protein